MAINAQEVIDSAIEHSELNNADLVPTNEMLRWITNFEKKLYIDAAKFNPDFFGDKGTTLDRDDHDTTWDLRLRPGRVAAVSIAKVESIVGNVDGVQVGDEVNLISIRQPQVALPPRAYVMDHKIHQFEDELGEDASNYVQALDIWYSKLPRTIINTSQTTTLPEEWADLLIIPLARKLAMRERRTEEVTALDQEYEFVYQSFLRQVESFDHGATRSLQAVRAAGPMDFTQEP